MASQLTGRRLGTGEGGEEACRTWLDVHQCIVGTSGTCLHDGHGSTMACMMACIRDDQAYVRTCDYVIIITVAIAVNDVGIGKGNITVTW